MRAINLTARPVELSPVNGGMLAPSGEPGTTDHERELVELTRHEEALQRAGIITLTGRKPKPPTEDNDDA